MSEPRFGGEAYHRRNCIGMSPDLFFFDREDAPNETARAKKVCDGCAVQDACLEYALKNRIEEGVWGGSSGADRRRIQQRRRSRVA